MVNVMTVDATVIWRVTMIEKQSTIKSVHIKECWPFEYVAPIRGKTKVISQFSKDKANARKRELYHQKKKLMELKVFELDIDFCNRLNNESQSSK